MTPLRAGLILAVLALLVPSPAAAQTAGAAQAKPIDANAVLTLGKKNSTVRVKSLRVRAPKGTLISVSCVPRSLCAPHSLVKRRRGLVGLRRLRNRTVRRGNQIVVKVTKTGRVGHVTRFIIGRTGAAKIQGPLGRPAEPDTDKDGFADSIDVCKDQYGVAPRGCPAPTLTDRDGDGISDTADECPDKAGAPPRGCEAIGTAPAGTDPTKGGGETGDGGSTPEPAAPDADRDGTPDAQDACPQVAGVPALAGCPDRDSDGLRDADDACPDVAGPHGAGGCPDGDADNIRDTDDTCPGAAGPAQYGGCPDSDGDQIRDIDDDCVGDAGPPQHGGCPDSDGDGLRDPNDTCPDQHGNRPNGCQNQAPSASNHSGYVFNDNGTKHIRYFNTATFPASDPEGDDLHYVVKSTSFVRSDFGFGYDQYVGTWWVQRNSPSPPYQTITYVAVDSYGAESPYRTITFYFN